MQLETITNNKPQYSYVRDGIEGNRQVIYKMIALVNNTVDYDNGFNEMVNDLIVSKGYDEYTNEETVLNLVYSFIRNHVKYRADKAGKIESIKDARTTLSNGYGDCDDLSILTASMLGALGFENVNFVLASYTTGELHIYTEVFDRNKKRYVLDLSLPENLAQLNYEIPAKKTESFPVFNQAIASKVAGAFFALKGTGKEIIKQAINTLPYGLQFMPLSIFPANLMLQGVNLINGADINSLSLNELGARIHSELDNLILQIQSNQIADDFVIPTAMQIISQLSAYNLDESERDTFKTIADSIKNKIIYIKQLLATKDTCINLNPKGMIFAGSLLIGFIGYQLYKQGKY